MCYYFSATETDIGKKEQIRIKISLKKSTFMSWVRKTAYDFISISSWYLKKLHIEKKESPYTIYFK